MKLQTQLLLGTAAILTIVTILSVAGYRNVYSIIESDERIVHTHQVIGNMRQMLKNMVDMETGQRGFLITGNESFLQPYWIGQSEFNVTMEATLSLVSDNSPQIEKLREIERLKESWLTDAGQYEINLRRRVDRGELTQFALSNILQGRTIDGQERLEEYQTGMQILDQIRNINYSIIEVEEELLVKRQAVNALITTQWIRVMFFGTLFVLFTGIYSAFYFSKKIKKRLSADKIAAEAANKAKSNFIASMSHELRTPLNAILGFSEVMEKEMFGPLGDPRYHSYAADIHKSGQHLLSVINDILSVSRLEAGKTQLSEEDAINVEELLRKAVSWVDGHASESGIELYIDIASGIPALRGDSRLLTQVLLNLLSNAIKFTPRGGLIEIRAKETKAGGVDITVRDTGVGMTAGQIARIGEPFLQFDDSLSRKFDGTGLGLMIARQLVELHGGHLEVQSTCDVGTTVSIHLPPERSVRQISPSTSEPLAVLPEPSIRTADALSSV